MSKPTKFKVRVGETEIELEGDEEKIIPAFEKAFAWASSQKPVSQLLPDKSQIEKGKASKKEVEGRGGPRKTTISPIVENIVKEGYLKIPNKRKLGEILEEMGRRGYPSTGKSVSDAVYNKLRRMRKTGEIKGAKESGEWTYWTEA